MENIKENIRKVFESKSLFKFVIAIGILIVALVIFVAGMTVGFHQASFERDWGEHYGKNFGMMTERFGGNYFPTAHGATGKIISMAEPNIVVRDKDNTEKVILIDDDTRIQEGHVLIMAADMKIDEFVVVIGNPNSEGVIRAKLIRVIPSPDLLNQGTPVQ